MHRIRSRTSSKAFETEHGQYDGSRCLLPVLSSYYAAKSNILPNMWQKADTVRHSSTKACTPVVQVRKRMQSNYCMISTTAHMQTFHLLVHLLARNWGWRCLEGPGSRVLRLSTRWSFGVAGWWSMFVQGGVVLLLLASWRFLRPSMCGMSGFCLAIGVVYALGGLSCHGSIFELVVFG